MPARLGTLRYVVRAALTGIAVSSVDVEVRRQGATVSTDQSKTSGQSIAVNYKNAILVGQTCQVWRGETTRVSSSGGDNSFVVSDVTVTTVTFSGFSGTLSLVDDDRISISSSLPTLYKDASYGEELANPLESSTPNGEAVCNAPGGFYDIHESGGGVTTRLVADVYVTAEPYNIRVTDAPYFAKFDGSTDDRAAIQQAIDDMSDMIVSGNIGRGVVECPYGIARISAPLVLKNRVILRGVGKVGTQIEPTDSFSWNGTTDALVQIGAPAGGANIDNARVESMSLMCRMQANSIGLYSDQANEGAGWRDIAVRQAGLKGVYLASSPARNLACAGIDITGLTTGGIGIHLNAVTESNTFRDITVGAASIGTEYAHGILIEGASWANFERVHTEDAVIGVEYAATAQGVVDGLVGPRCQDALIKFNGDGQGVYNLNPVTCDHLIIDNSGHTGNTVTIDNGATGSYYYIGRGGTGGGRDLHTDFIGTVVTPTTRDTQLVRLVQGLVSMNNNFCFQRNPITAAATIDATLFANRGNYWTLSGATNVTSITCDSDDTGRLLIIAGAAPFPTIVDGGNINIKGNWVCGATGDTLTLICDATNWHEVARSV